MAVEAEIPILSSWRAPARHPRLGLDGQQALMPICIGMTDGPNRRVGINAG
jgi:hypothetical protein